MADIRSDCIPVDVLRELLSYDAETGKLYWRTRLPKHFRDGKHSASHTSSKWNGMYAGKEALTAVEPQGYLHGDIFGKRYKAHRVIWALTYGKWPTSDIDHINGNSGDNRIENLRVVSKEENMRNQRRSSANKSGVTGVCWNPIRRKWSAQIKVRGKKYHLGLFDQLMAAAAARKVAEKHFGFHPNHGRVA